MVQRAKSRGASNFRFRRLVRPSPRLDSSFVWHWEKRDCPNGNGATSYNDTSYFSISSSGVALLTWLLLSFSGLDRQLYHFILRPSKSDSLLPSFGTATLIATNGHFNVELTSRSYCG